MARFFNTKTGLLSLLAAVVFVSGCGGGTSPSAEAASVTTRKLTASVTLQAADGVAGTRFAESDQFDAVVIVNETVTTTSGSRTLSTSTAPANDATVTLVATGATVTPASGTGLTDASGRAVFRLLAGTEAGAYQVAVKAEKGSASPVEVIAPFAVDRLIQPMVTLDILQTDGSGVRSARPGEPLRVVVQAYRARMNAIGVVEQLQPAGDVRVSLSTDEGRFDPAVSAVFTDAAGSAVATFIPGLRDGMVAVTALAEIDGKTVTARDVVDVRVPRVILYGGSPEAAGVLTIDPPVIEAGAEARILAAVVADDGRPFEQPVQVTLTSMCLSNGAASLLSPVLTAGAQLASTYRPSGCVGVDRIRAEVAVPGLEEPAVAEATIQIRAPNAEGLLFVGANPADIALRGRGTATRPDRSTVTFRVQNASGVPVQNARVVFALSGRVGDASLRYPEATSDAAGEVRAIVDAGDFAAALSVQATTVGAGGIVYTAMSQQITISTGGADQDSMSLSVETFNIEGWNFDGVTTGINVRAADRFNNPVADGTRLSFIAEGGAVQPSCATQGGACSVLLTSQNPRPSDGRVSVLVRTEGSESFVDANGNGMYDLGESFTDLPEAWLDSDEDGTRDSNEAFSDYNNNGVYDGPNGRFDGGPCTVPSQCGLAVDVRAQTVVVFSTSRALVQILPTQIRVDDVSPVSVVVLVSDEHGNLPPAGTKVDIETGNGEIAGATSFTIGNTNARGPLTYQFQIIGDGEASTGTLNVDVTSPAGFVSRDQATVIDTTQNITVGDVRITPQTVTVAAGTVTEQNIAVTITQGATGIAGVTPGFACEAGTSVGLLVESIAAVQPTDGAGATMLRVRATAAANASGDVVCAVRAGDKSANLTIRGPSANASAPGVLTVSPTQVTVQPGQTGFAVNPLMTLVNAETPGRPIAGFYPVVRCQNINATQLTVTPGVVTPTDANGQTVLSFFYTTGAAPTGEAVCEVVAGSLRQEIRFVP